MINSESMSFNDLRLGGYVGRPGLELVKGKRSKSTDNCIPNHNIKSIKREMETSHSGWTTYCLKALTTARHFTLLGISVMHNFNIRRHLPETKLILVLKDDGKGNSTILSTCCHAVLFPYRCILCL